MRGALAWLLLVLAGCTSRQAAVCADDAKANHHAVNPTTGECWEFTSSCQVPPDWQPCPAPPCQIDDECSSGYSCVEGGCQPQVAQCHQDSECPPAQHCTAGLTCADNAACSLNSQCAGGEYCDPVTLVCTRGSAPGNFVCATSEDCGPDEVCPAQYGQADLPGGQSCTPACHGETDCGTDMRCNTVDICAGVDAGACAGWCVPIAKNCTTSADCKSREVCPAQYVPGAPATCATACLDESACATGQPCVKDACVVPNPKPDGPSARLLECWGYCGT